MTVTEEKAGAKAMHGRMTAGTTWREAGLDPASWSRSLFEALVDAAAGAAGRRPAVEDQDGQPLDRRRLILAAAVLGRRLAGVTTAGEKVGVLLPNVNGAAVTVFALAAYGRVPAMLNFSAGVRNLEAALEAADVRTIVTSRRFVDTLKLDEVVARLSERARVVYLEDLRKEIGAIDKALGVVFAAVPRLVHRLFFRRRPDDPAVVLFTSGTEGVPKGVVLSNANILANIAQIRAAYPFAPEDCIFNALPVFHSFGLTAGLFLPVFGGFRSFLYPSPLHYKQIPGFVRKSAATILLTTDTFAAGWAKAAEAEDFRSVRFTVLGAERVKEPTRKLWRERFGVSLNEGYGVTETAPVLAVNRPGAERDGTVGTLLPGIEARLEPVPGLDEGGRLFIRGPNVMVGYYKVDRPGVLEPIGEWHDTGDIVTIDADGFVAIKGRAKRFAKIGGEMVSLAAVEAYAAAVWPDASHAVVAIPDARKGEALVLVTDEAEAAVEPIVAYAQAHGVPELMVPKRILHVDALPVMGTGKLDLVSIDAMAREKLIQPRADS
jgi:acyl-[acyl-carrier-protein]-phospholipid O-acyltransferase/long-chain-fatty-acid--[acyl-carrier-protein] ligase